MSKVDKQNWVSFDKELLLELIEEYQTALEEEQEIFFFKGNELDVKYAKYLIEYLKTKIKTTK